MRRQDALLVAMSLGIVAFAVTFVYPQFTGQAVPWYYPLEHRWAYEPAPKGLAMDFYGRLLFGVIAWCVVVVVSLLVTRRLKSLSTRMAGLLATWACAITLLVAMHFAWSLYFRIPEPAPLPAGYQPR